MVADAENIARGKRAWNLPENDDPKHAANQSVDGNIFTYSYATSRSGRSAWAVDLGDVYNHISLTYYGYSNSKYTVLTFR